MSQPIQHVNACPSLGHIYASVLVMRCPHLEAYALHAHSWQDDDRGDPIQLWDTKLEFGPFDEQSYIRLQAGYLAERAVLETQLAGPAYSGARLL